VATHLLQLAPRVCFCLTRSSILLCNCRFYTFGVSEFPDILQMDTGGLSPNPTDLFLYVFMSAHLVVLAGSFWGPKHCFFGLP
jgi:hypothetical protein